MNFRSIFDPTRAQLKAVQNKTQFAFYIIEIKPFRLVLQQLYRRVFGVKVYNSQINYSVHIFKIYIPPNLDRLQSLRKSEMNILHKREFV